MNNHASPRKPNAGGIFLFACLIIGSLAGLAMGEPSAGMIGGFAVGVIIALIIWLRDRSE
jgi:hypothetical protein